MKFSITFHFYFCVYVGKTTTAVYPEYYEIKTDESDFSKYAGVYHIQPKDITKDPIYKKAKIRNYLYKYNNTWVIGESKDAEVKDPVLYQDGECFFPNNT